MFAALSTTRSLSHSSDFRLAFLLLISAALTACGSSDDSVDSLIDDDTTPIGALINRDNYADVLTLAFHVYVGDAYNQPPIDISEFTITGRNPDDS